MNKLSNGVATALVLLNLCITLPTEAATSYSKDLQKIEVSMELQNVSLKNVFDQIEKQTHLVFAYNNADVNIARKVSVNAKSQSVESVLSRILADTGLLYKVDSRYITVYSENKAATPAPFQNGKKITGTILDERGEPVIGANVVEKGTTNGVITDLDGNFSLAAKQGATLVISYVGYLPKEIKATVNVVNIRLTEDTQKLDEVVVVGYGSQKKVNLTGAVTTVKMDQVLGNRPVSSALSALEGSVPGLQINKNSGKPGETINTNIRGVTSINGGSPLVLVDNVPMDLAMIDPSDIESVSVLKDAAASAIYGARAAFGVILVTTKQGKKDMPARFTYTNNFAFSNPATRPQKVTPRQTLDVFQDMGMGSYYAGQNMDKWSNYMNEYNNQGLYPEGYVYSDGMRYDLAAGDAYADMMDSFGFQHQHNISVQGGGAKTNYRLSAGMVDEDGILVTNKDRYKRYNTSAFISTEVSGWLTAQMDVKYSNAKTSTTAGNVMTGSGAVSAWFQAVDLAAMAPLGEGKARETDEVSYPFGTPRHAIEAAEPQTNRISDVRILGRVIITPLKGWNITGEYSYNRDWTSVSSVLLKTKMIDPSDYIMREANTKSKYSMQNTFYDRNSINLFSTYTRSFGGHEVSVMGGFNQESYHYESLNANRLDLINENLPSIGQATGTIDANDAFSEYALRSLFYRVNYSYKDRYLAEANGRYDGSSRFSKKGRFGFFPSFSAAWRLSEEAFMEDAKDVFNNIKIRGSWGNIGNQNVGMYAYLPTMATDKPQWILPGAADYVTSLKTPALVSQLFTWESVQTLDIGVDVSLFNKLNISGDYYVRNTLDMLGPSQPLPTVLGTAAPQANAADLRTKGWELSVEWRDKINDNWSYNLGFNIYDSRSVVTKYSNESGVLSFTNTSKKQERSLRKDMAFGEIWGYTTERYFTANDFEADGKTLKPGMVAFKGQKIVYPGDIKYVDKDNSGTIDNGDNTESNPGDLSVIGNSTPRFQYGIMGGLRWKDIDFSFFFTGVGQRDIWLPGFFPKQGTFIKGIEPHQLDYWRENRQEAFYPRVSANEVSSNNGEIQTKYLVNGAYLRLKNVSLAYSLPKKVCGHFGITNFKVFVTGENLLTFHHLPKGYYPDSFGTKVGDMLVSTEAGGNDKSGNFNYPLMRQYAFGINITF